MKPWKPAAGTSAASSPGACMVAPALATALSSRASSKGLTRKSKAPARIACTARLIEPLAVMTITRVSGASRASGLEQLEPVAVGELEVEQHDPRPDPRHRPPAPPRGCRPSRRHTCTAEDRPIEQRQRGRVLDEEKAHRRPPPLAREGDRQVDLRRAVRARPGRASPPPRCAPSRSAPVRSPGAAGPRARPQPRSGCARPTGSAGGRPARCRRPGRAALRAGRRSPCRGARPSTPGRSPRRARHRSPRR